MRLNNKNIMYKLLPIISLLILITSCSKKDETIPTTQLEFTYNFKSNTQNWQGGFSDYPQGQETFYVLVF